MALFLGIDSKIKWVEDIATIPLVGHIFLFVLTFVPAVLLSFISQSIFPMLNNDVGFTKAILILLPLWNLSLWIQKIKVYVLFIPSWLLSGIIAIIKGYLMFKGIDDGQS